MAGSNPDFPTAEVRDGLRFAMAMGSPNRTEEKATFRWEKDRTYAQMDAGNKPFDWTSSPTAETDHDDVVLDHVAVEIQAGRGGGAGTAVGEFETTRVVLTLLDEEFDLIDGHTNMPDLVPLGGNTYEINFVAPPVGMFDLTVYSIHATARDES